MPKIIVCIKQAVDVTQIRADPSTRKLITADAPRKISDIDKNALEEAIRIKEKQGGEIIAVTIGDENAKTALREALAMGADKAYHLNDPAFQNTDTRVTSLILAEAVRKIGEFDLILCGETTIDSFTGITSQRVAERSGIPLIMYARKMNLESGVVVAEKVLEDRFETVKAKTPALITVVKGINEPRIPSLMAIMKASKKEIVVWNAEAMGIPKEKLVSALEIVEVLAPKMERKKIVIKGETPAEIAEKLVKALVQEGVVGR
ncbi:MAG: electron transfer flavoprotein subunit beta/FixA family protein [Candidatus Bathyarchaeia archaeon]|jgi:electron transfer flavoprotein beta subunit|nr:electron transfer flavoprotein subunit beta/FixA family protein [Candidatus Bathyarchaeota archaeon A05DMB-4]MDH7595365.1 electron transfer flavoprotein subunit beta/FixA family protein [Candidatus Bathyarchaeota archaeon]